MTDQPFQINSDRGWRKLDEPCLHIYAHADGSSSYYFKGSLNGRPKTVKLEARSLAEREARVSCAARRPAQGSRAGRLNRRVTVNTYADRFLQAQADRVGHPNPKLRRSARGVELDAQRLRDFVLPELGRRKLAELDVAELRSFVAGLYALARATVRHTPRTPSATSSGFSVPCCARR